MRLSWQASDTFAKYEATGDEYSYTVVSDGHGGYAVSQSRQPGGQQMRRTYTGNLEGAFARAQVWENG